MHAHRALLLMLSVSLLFPWGAGAQTSDSFLDALLGSGTPATQSVETPAADTDSVALLWETDAYTPPLYGGKSLPSAGTKIHLWAIPHVAGTSEQNLTFTWKLDGATLPLQSGVGKSSATINAPTLFSTYVVSVEVRAASGAHASAETGISSVEPQVRLYPDHPLFGIEYWSALGTHAFLAEREMTFASIPYFAPATRPDDRALIYSWRIDGKKILANPERPSAVTVSAGNDGAVATLALTLTHASNFLVEARGAWQVTLGAGAGASLFDPFGGQ